MNYTQLNPVPLPENGDEYNEIKSTIGTIFDWKYSLENKGLMGLYEKGKSLNWNATTELDWDTEVDMEKLIDGRKDQAQQRKLLFEVPPEISDDLWTRMLIERNSFMLSQFLHGEQGAMLGAARMVQVCPDAEAKFYAATQTLDETRHVEVYHRYLTEKLGSSYPIGKPLKGLLDDILTTSDWDMAFLGLQIMVEGVALGAFSFVKISNPDEPLLLDITDRIMQDESRHVAFGVNTLSQIYNNGELTESEMRQREDFVIEASYVLRDRLNADPIFDRLGVKLTPEMDRWNREAPFLKGVTHMTFSKVVPNLKRIGMLTPRVRDAYEKMDLLRFENYKDSIEDPNITPPEELVKILMSYIREDLKDV